MLLVAFMCALVWVCLIVWQVKRAYRKVSKPTAWEVFTKANLDLGEPVEVKIDYGTKSLREAWDTAFTEANRATMSPEQLADIVCREMGLAFNWNEIAEGWAKYFWWQFNLACDCGKQYCGHCDPDEYGDTQGMDACDCDSTYCSECYPVPVDDTMEPDYAREAERQYEEEEPSCHLTDPCHQCDRCYVESGGKLYDDDPFFEVDPELVQTAKDAERDFAKAQDRELRTKKMPGYLGKQKRNHWTGRRCALKTRRQRGSRQSWRAALKRQTG